MELCSPLFQQAVLKALVSPKKVLGTITIANLPVIKKIKSRPDVILLNLQRNNQKEVYQYIVDLLAEN
jgi:nucleoside-triphosphatase THEP1